MPRNYTQQADGMTGEYPANWPEIAKRVKDAASWNCERCGHAHNPELGYTLTTAHLIPDKSNCEDWNLAALCQRCHLHVQGKIDFTQQYMFSHSDWMKPHVDLFKRAMGLAP